MHDKMIHDQQSKLIEKLVLNRLSVAILLFLVLMASFIPLVVFQDQLLHKQPNPSIIPPVIWLLLPTVTAGILFFWLIFSSGKKEQILAGKDGNQKSSEVWEQIENSTFGRHHKSKLLFASYGLAGGLIIILIAVLAFISPELISLLFESWFLVLALSMVIAYIFLRKRLK